MAAWATALMATRLGAAFFRSTLKCHGVQKGQLLKLAGGQIPQASPERKPRSQTDEIAMKGIGKLEPDRSSFEPEFSLGS